MCPWVDIFHDPTSAVLTRVEACLDAYDANNRRIKVPNPAVSWTDSEIIFRVVR